MNWPHLHLMINHFPVIGMIFAVLLLVYALARKSEELKKTGLGAFVLLALVTVPVYLTGQASVDSVQKLPGVMKKYIDRHEDLASLTLLLVETLGIISLGGLFFFRGPRAIPKWFAGLVLLLSLVAVAAAGLTANMGGQIRHTEIREEITPPPPAGQPELKDRSQKASHASH